MDEHGEDNLSAKKQIEEYVKKHDLEVSLNLAVNRIVKDRPEDPFSVLATLLKAESKAPQGITHIEGRQIFDSRGIPTIMVMLTTNQGVFTASVPSTVPGKYDVEEKSTDHDEETDPNQPKQFINFNGKGVDKAAFKIHSVLQSVLEKWDPTRQAEIDMRLENPEIENAIGRNAVLATSMAVCKAGACHSNMDLYKYIAQLANIPRDKIRIPIPAFSMINGGKYAPSKIYLQDILAMPTDAKSFEEALTIGIEIRQHLKKKLEEAGVLGHTNTGSFGGYAAMVSTPEEALGLVKSAIDETIEAMGDIATVRIAVDVAASEFFVPSDADSNDLRTVFFYNVDKWVPQAKGLSRSSEDLADLYRKWYHEYRIISIIDPFHTKDIQSYKILNNSINDKARIAEASKASATQDAIGGDINCRLQVIAHTMADAGLDKLQHNEACDTVLVNLSRHKTVTSAIAAANETRRLSWGLVVGCSDHETDDTFVVDFAIGVGSRQIRIGGLCCYEQMGKYNHLLSISNSQDAPSYSGEFFRRDYEEITS